MVELNVPIELMFEKVQRMQQKIEKLESEACIQKEGSEWNSDQCDMVKKEIDGEYYNTCQCKKLNPTTIIKDTENIFKNSTVQQQFSGKGVKALSKFEFHKSYMVYLYAIQFIIHILCIKEAIKLDKKSKKQNQVCISTNSVQKDEGKKYCQDNQEKVIIDEIQQWVTDQQMASHINLNNVTNTDICILDKTEQDKKSSIINNLSHNQNQHFNIDSSSIQVLNQSSNIPKGIVEQDDAQTIVEQGDVQQGENNDEQQKENIQQENQSGQFLQQSGVDQVQKLANDSNFDYNNRSSSKKRNQKRQLINQQSSSQNQDNNDGFQQSSSLSIKLSEKSKTQSEEEEEENEKEKQQQQQQLEQNSLSSSGLKQKIQSLRSVSQQSEEFVKTQINNDQDNNQLEQQTLQKNDKSIWEGILIPHQFFGIFLNKDENLSRVTRFNLYYLWVQCLLVFSCIFTTRMASISIILFSVIGAYIVVIPIEILDLLLRSGRKVVRILGVIFFILLYLQCLYIIISASALMKIERSNEWTIQYFSSFMIDMFIVQFIQNLVVIHLIKNYTMKGKYMFLEKILKNKDVEEFYQNK